MAGVGMVRFLNGADWSESEWFRGQINTRRRVWENDDHANRERQLVIV